MNRVLFTGASSLRGKLAKDYTVKDLNAQIANYICTTISRATRKVGSIASTIKPLQLLAWTAPNGLPRVWSKLMVARTQMSEQREEKCW